MARFVVTFDTPEPGMLEDVAPGLLRAQGFSTEAYYPRLGIGVIEGESQQMAALDEKCREQQVPLNYTPELRYFAIEGVPSSPPADFADTESLTWGLQAIGISSAQQQGRNGQGVRVAVLDTGIAAKHRDFSARGIVAESFIEGEGPEDVHGHGTHCIGTACGPWQPAAGPAYGVAPGSEIYSGKVLSDDGSGSDASILAGIDWALEHDCHVISMSLGADVRAVHPPYVAAGRRALDRGTLIVAAAGNNARRASGDPGFVGAPANSPHVMAVAALDRSLGVADFSAQSSPHDGGEVNIAAPGVDVHSAWPGEEQYRGISGTSMAAPHVSGIAALLCSDTGTRGEQLWEAVVAAAGPLDGAETEDVGAGAARLPD